MSWSLRSCPTCPEVTTPIRCSMADTRMVGCVCFRLRSSDVSELSMNYTQEQAEQSCCVAVDASFAAEADPLAAHLEFPAAHRQREELMEETFTLLAADVRHVTLQDTVQRSAVPEEDKHQVGYGACSWRRSTPWWSVGDALPGLQHSDNWQQALVEGGQLVLCEFSLTQVVVQQQPVKGEHNVRTNVNFFCGPKRF